jgi:hypothetical protein
MRTATVSARCETLSPSPFIDLTLAYSGRVIEELGIRRSDLILTGKIFFGQGRKGPNDKGLSRKQ